MYCESGAEDIAHDTEIGLCTFHGEAKHSQILRQEGLASPLDYELAKKKKIYLHDKKLEKS